MTLGLLHNYSVVTYVSFRILGIIARTSLVVIYMSIFMFLISVNCFYVINIEISCLSDHPHSRQRCQYVWT